MASIPQDAAGGRGGGVPFLTNLEAEGKFCHCHPSKFSLSRAAPALGLAPSTQNQRLAHNSTSVTWCDTHQVQDTYDHTIHKQVCPYKASIRSGGLALSVLSTQMNHIRQTDRHAYTSTAGTHPSYQGQSTSTWPYRPKYAGHQPPEDTEQQSEARAGFHGPWPTSGHLRLLALKSWESCCLEHKSEVFCHLWPHITAISSSFWLFSIYVFANTPLGPQEETRQSLTHTCEQFSSLTGGIF